ncbi:MAG: gamma carbonic anhydrase family protein [Pseudomonadota bacterium]
MTLYALDGVRPQLPADASHFVAPGAQVIGHVVLGQRVSIWFNAVLRGDNEPITLGAGSNVQDGCVFHTDPGFPLTLGAEVTVGHGAILHGCSVGAGSLIGMGAVILNGAVIGEGCLVGANALVTEGKVFPDGAMILGQPAKQVKTLPDDAVDGLRATAAGYRARIERYRGRLTALD